MKFLIPKGTSVYRMQGDFPNNDGERISTDFDVIYDELDLRAGEIGCLPKYRSGLYSFIHFSLPKICHPWKEIEVKFSNIEIL